MIKKSFIVFLVFGFVCLGMMCSFRSRTGQKPSIQSNQAKIVTTKESVQIVSHEENNRWYTSIIRSGFDDDGLSTFMNTMIVDTVVVAERIDIKDFL